MDKNKSRIIVSVVVVTLSALLLLFYSKRNGESLVDELVEVRLNHPVDVKSGEGEKPQGEVFEVPAKGPLASGGEAPSPATQTKGSVSGASGDNLSKDSKDPKDKEASSVSHDIQIKKKVLNSMLQAGKGTKFKVVLFEGQEIKVSITRRDPLLEKGAILYGTVDGEPGSSAHFSIYEGAMFAKIMFGTQRYKIDYKKDGEYKLSEIGLNGLTTRFNGGCGLFETENGVASKYRLVPRKNFLPNRYMLDPAISSPEIFCLAEGKDEKSIERQKKRLSMRYPMGGLQSQDAAQGMEMQMPESAKRSSVQASRRPIGFLPPGGASGGGSGGGGGGGTAGQVTVMFCYTSELEADIGATAVVAKAGIFEASMNKCFSNSGIQNNVKTVGTFKTSKNFTFSEADMQASLSWMRDDSGGVGAERDKLKADLVSLLVKGSGQGGVLGMAWLLDAKATKPEKGFSVFHHDSPDLVFAHELGHNYGCGHSLLNPKNSGASSYSHGDFFTGDDGKMYCTVMGYAHLAPGGQGSTWVEYFSSPIVKYKGKPTSNDGSKADNVKSIKELIPFIQKNRQ
ncbi:MAG: M12 family metallo-peptidase [Verrucomicrobiota bacterium]|nr:M12 family metallo-peptidase [Verrucomicrobiota bacterium]